MDEAPTTCPRCHRLTSSLDLRHSCEDRKVLEGVLEAVDREYARLMDERAFVELLAFIDDVRGAHKSRDGERWLEANLIARKARVFVDAGELRSATAAFRKRLALPFFDRQGEERAQILAELALVSESLGNLDEALTLIQEALTPLQPQLPFAALVLLRQYARLSGVPASTRLGRAVEASYRLPVAPGAQEMDDLLSEMRLGYLEFSQAKSEDGEGPNEG